jgi:murein DD-endopeptidase MepM/ murein hydrolase activator NlpD
VRSFRVLHPPVLGAAVCLCAVAYSMPALASVARSRAGRGAATKAAPVANVRVLRHMVRHGETFAGLLQSQGVHRRDVATWYGQMRGAIGAFQLVPEHVLTLQFAGPGQLTQLTYDVDDQNQITVERDGKRLRARTEPLAVITSVVGAQGVVEKNFHVAAVHAGIPDRIISQMADILGWEFDFRRVKSGDRFRVVYERRVSRDGRVLTPGRVLAAEINGARRSAQAFYYDDGVEGTYVDGSGRVLAQSFLRYPVEFTRVSSVFSDSRFHPILRRSRPHNGVDFAAPPGTPVRAASDGVVVVAGRNGDFGNQVALSHGRGVETAYSHLRGIARGIRPGLAVRQGQIIGFVGQSGLATGAHLHFSLFHDGKYLNPLTARVPLLRTVGDPRRFQLAKQALLVQLASIARPPTAASVEPVPVMVAASPATRRSGLVAITQ